MQNIWIQSMYLKKRHLNLKAEFIWHWKNICYLQDLGIILSIGRIITKKCRLGRVEYGNEWWKMLC